MRQHAFVAMPFGCRDGIDFNRVHAELIKPALQAAGFDVFRADEELRAGEIRKDMFQELLLADLVVVDLSIDNPNVWYELGVRHALRARGVVQILGPQRDRLPFDIATDRVLRYHEVFAPLEKPDATACESVTACDSVTLKADRERLTKFVQETMNAWQGWKVSPVYQLIPNLEEPDFQSLRVVEATQFWDEYQRWRDRLDVARRQQRTGTILVLADEAPTRTLRLTASLQAARALTALGRYEFACEQVDAALAVDQNSRDARCIQAVLLGRLGKLEEARAVTRRLVEDDPDDAEAWALAGRLEKTEWLALWQQPGNSSGSSAAQQSVPARDLASAEDAQLQDAIEAYRHAFAVDARHFYSGINLLVLLMLQRELGGDLADPRDIDIVRGAVQWATRCALARDPNDYWARACQAELCLLDGEPDLVLKATRKAMAAAPDWFALDSTRQTLLMFRDLEFRKAQVDAAMSVVDVQIARVAPPWTPRQVLLFSGHMIDNEKRVSSGKPARFPITKLPAAQQAVEAAVVRLDASNADIAICSAACGGDLLFCEAVLARGVRLQVHLPLPEPEFIERSVAFAGDTWRERFYAVRNHPGTTVRSMPDELGPVPEEVNVFVRNNRWLLAAALSRGPERVRFIALWDGAEGDGPGGTADLVTQVKRRSGQVHIIDIHSLAEAAP
jgi:tetratricopeptide (TPR) repeat protein